MIKKTLRKVANPIDNFFKPYKVWSMLNNIKLQESKAQVLGFDDLVKILDGNHSCRFVSLVYRAKESGELARHTIMLNARRDSMLKHDLAALQAKRPQLDSIMAQACDELIASITETLTTGQNSQYTKQGYYEAQGKGNLQISVNDVCYIRGYSIGKEVLEEGTHKKVNSRPLTIAKNALRKELKNTRCREFRVTRENFQYAKHDGKVILIDAGSNLDRLAGLPPIAMSVPVTA